MRISELLTAIASELQNPNSALFCLAEYDEECLKVVAAACLKASDELMSAAEVVENIEPPVESVITPESIESLSDLAATFDLSGDEELKKQASVIDELLLTIAAPKLAERKDLLNDRLEQLKKNYQAPKEIIDEMNSVSQSLKAIDKSKMTKNVEIHQSPLSTRYCPDHPGTSTYRTGEHLVQCPLDHKIYSFEQGYTLQDGTRVPGGDVSLQTANQISTPYHNHSIFDTREGRLGQNS
jgi:hypothetical protein